MLFSIGITWAAGPVVGVPAFAGISEASEAELATHASSVELSWLTCAARAGSIVTAPPFRSTAALTLARSPAAAREKPMKATAIALLLFFGLLKLISVDPS